MRQFLFRSLQHAFEGGVKRRPTFRHLRDLSATQWLDPEALRALQLRALRRLLTHARDRCPYYRETWARAGVSPDEVRSLDDFAAWPIVTRDAIRAHRTRMRARDPRLRLIAKATGGSTGAPLAFDLDHGSYARRMAAAFRGYDWAGAGPGAKAWYLWGGPLTPPTRAAAIRSGAYERLYRRRTVNCFELRDDRLPAIARDLNAYRPDVIVAYTSAIDAFARGVLERKLDVWSPNAIVVGAEKLHDFQRERISSAFGAPVFETYGSREFMLMAAECERHAGLHLTMEHLVVEIVDAAGRPVPPGTEGDVVVTDLYNYGMPFIRYLNGDRAIASGRRCACGRGLAMLEKVTGRRLDVLRTPDGRSIPGEYFPHLLKEFETVRRFQVEQESLDRITVRIVTAGDAAPVAAAIEHAVRPIVGAGVSLTVQPVADIALTASGKLNVVVSRV